VTGNLCPERAMRRRLNHPRHHGFTLIEAIAAIVILSISVPAMLWSVRHAHIQRVNPTMASTARWLAMEKLEDVIADAHSSTRGYGYVVNANYAAENPVSGFVAFTRAVSVVETGPDLVSAGTGYKKVTVTVSWTDATATARSLNIATVVTDQS
jgi:prepilin-type N-terminal cleavage/methylation domain-containing protein